MDSETTRPSLLSRVRDPYDDAAWREFESRYGDLIIRYCRSQRLQHSDAEDVRQLLMMNLSSALRNFQYDPSRGRFRSYLGRAVKNAIIQVRKCPRGQGIPLQLEEGFLESVSCEAEPDSDSVWDKHWCEHHLRRSFETLRQSFHPKSLEVFDMLLAGHSAPEVAEHFDMQLAAVKKIRQRVRLGLRKIVASQIAEDE